jgi:hypothetical protein
VPCLLALLVAGWGLLSSMIVSAMICFDTCPQHIPWGASQTGTDTIAMAELTAGAVALVSLIAGLGTPKARRALVPAGWVALLLACVGVALLYLSSLQ